MKAREEQLKTSTCKVTDTLIQQQHLNRESDLIQLLTEHSKLPSQRIERARKEYRQLDQEYKVVTKDQKEKIVKKPATFYDFLLQQFGFILFDQLGASASNALFSYEKHKDDLKDIQYESFGSMHLSNVKKYAFHACQKDRKEAGELLGSIILYQLPPKRDHVTESEPLRGPEQTALLLIESGADIISACQRGALNRLVRLSNLKLAEAILKTNKFNINRVPQGEWANAAACAVGKPHYEFMALFDKYGADYSHPTVLCNASLGYYCDKTFDTTRYVALNRTMLKFFHDHNMSEIDLLCDTRNFKQILYFAIPLKNVHNSASFEKMQNDLADAYKKNNMLLEPAPLILILLQKEAEKIKMKINIQPTDSVSVVMEKLTAIEDGIRSAADLFADVAEKTREIICRIHTAKVFLVMHQHFQAFRLAQQKSVGVKEEKSEKREEESHSKRLFT